MKKTPQLLTTLLILILAWTPSIDAQEDPDSAEVDRILTDLESDGIETDTVTDEAGAEEAFTPEDPTTLPAVSLEEAETVEGLEITGAENINEGLVTISYTEVSLADMVRIFAQTAGANIIIPEGLDQPVSGNLNDVYWRAALEEILRDQGFVLVERQANIFSIVPKDQLEAEPMTTEIIEFEYITAQAAQPAVQSLLITSNASAVALGDTNVLMVKERPQQLLTIKEHAKRIDRPRKQVFIEAKFVELSDISGSDLGINWQALQGVTVAAQGLTRNYQRVDTRIDQDTQVFTNNRNTTDSTTRLDNTSDPTLDSNIRTRTRSTGSQDALIQGRNFTGIDGETGAIELSDNPPRLETVTTAAVLTSSEFALTLSALQTMNGARIVSNPKILVASGESATIEIGTRVPNIRVESVDTEFSSREVSTLDSTEPYINEGITVEVTPTVSTGKNITVDILPILNRISRTIETTDGSTFYEIQTRRIMTEFAVQSGLTVAIGGLTITNDREEVSKVPLLGSIPVLGKYLFTHTSTSEVQDEIIIFITVKVINDTGDLNDRYGIPDEGKLIHTWLDLKTAEAEAAEAEASEAAEDSEE